MFEAENLIETIIIIVIIILITTIDTVMRTRWNTPDSNYGQVSYSEFNSARHVHHSNGCQGIRVLEPYLFGSCAEFETIKNAVKFETDLQQYIVAYSIVWISLNISLRAR